ncbi:MAG TPA: protein kinase, partial [Candidatus Acidoferrales bacterium]|nr:protein kinase [Candidatus Acidoferrales bacterium]
AKPVTAEGTIVGTFQYMSPEQLEGKEADERSDIFALGAVLYEMATGRRAFEGKSQTSVIAAILEREPPPISSLQPMSPPQLDHVVKLCLGKDPDERFQSAHDVKLQLELIRDAGSQAGVPASVVARRELRERVWMGATAILAIVAALLAYGFIERAPQPMQATRSSLLPPNGTSFAQYNFAVSPDGTRLAFVATDLNGKNMLWVRSLSASNAQQLNGTDDAMYPFWSPDSSHIGFFAEGKLKTVDIASSAVQILCEAQDGRGGTWNRDGVIVFAPDIAGPLYRISDTGGVPAAVTTIPRAGSAQAHRWPYFLPDGRHFLYFMDWSSAEDKQPNGIYAGSLDSSETKPVSTEIIGNVQYTSRNLLYVRDRSLMAQPFDAARLEITGAAVAIAEQEIQTDFGFSVSGYSVSQNGVIVFDALADSSSELVWFNSNGKQLGQVPGRGYDWPRLSPDRRFLAVASDDGLNGKQYIRAIDLTRGISTRITNGGAENTPSWSPDGKWITYNIGLYGGANRTGNAEVRADGSGQQQPLLKGVHLGFGDWSRDGRFFVFSDFSEGLPFVAVYSSADRQVTKFASRGAEARFSPDGRWIAYSGVFVQAFPGPGMRIQVSSGFGAQPIWNRDGKQLFYIAPDKTLMAVDFDSLKGTASAPRPLFKTRIVAPNFTGTEYDVSPDGRFLINSLPADHSSPLTLVMNWTAELTRH